MAPSGKLKFKKANKKTKGISTIDPSNEMLDFNELTDVKTVKSPKEGQRNNDEETQGSKMTNETTETVST